jgi:AraC-like DNA-binding protein
MTDLVRGTILHHYPDLLSELGGNFKSIAVKEGVDASIPGDYERFIPYSSVAALIGGAAKDLNCPDFALRLGTQQTVQILGPLAVLFRHSETVAEAIEVISRYIHLCAPLDVFQLRRGPRTTALTFTIELQRLNYREYLVEKSVATTVRVLRDLIGEDFAPAKVTMQHARISPIERYRDVFRCPVEFGREENAVHLPSEFLPRQVPGRDPAALALARGYFAQSKLEVSLVDQVRETTRRLLEIERATLVTVAEALALHPRVMQRRLSDAGVAFENILDDERRVMAWRLSAMGMRISEIAAKLGYSEQSSYARACRRWYGMPPRRLTPHSKSSVQS